MPEEIMKPGDFFIGVLDFFAVLLPGSLAAWLVTRYVPSSAMKSALAFEFIDADAKPDSLVVVGVFFVASYLLGHFVFMAGSKLDSSYDRWRERVHSPERDASYSAAKALRHAVTPQLDGSELSVLKWARAYIQVRSAAARVEIDRLEAEQKFFRGLVVIGAIFAAHFILGERSLFGGAIALSMSALSYKRYLDRRWTMTELIFATAVIVNAAGGSAEGAKSGADQRGGDD